MAVRIPQYQQQTSPNSLGVTPHARGVEVDTSLARAGQQFAGALAGAAGTVADVQERARLKREQEEKENAAIWAGNAMANAAMRAHQEQVKRREQAGDGAADFTQGMLDWTSEDEETIISQAPNDAAKKFVREGYLRLRMEVFNSATAFEDGERQKWRVDTVKDSIEAVSSVVAQDPTQFNVRMAEQRAVIDALNVPPDTKRAMREALTDQVSTAYVLGDAERNPSAALGKLYTRLGTRPPETGKAATMSRDAKEVQAKYETIGGAFGFETTSATRTPGENAAVGGVPDSQHLSGTARDWSIHGKSQAEVQGFVAALQADGFEAFVHKVKGGALHVHAELPPARKQRTVEQAVAENPEGEHVGETAYDLLPLDKVVSLLGTVRQKVDQQQSQMRTIIAMREADDLAAYGDGKMPSAPLAPADFAVFGGLEGARRWQNYQNAQRFATQLQGLATKTPAEIQALAAAGPSPDQPGYASAAQAHGALVQAAGAVLTQRAEDPVAFAIEHKLVNAQPLNFQDADAMGAELKNRVGVAQTMNQQYGTRYTLLTKQEATQMTTMLGGMTAPEKAQFLSTVRSNLPDPTAYQSIMATLRPDSPVTATAGSLMAVGGKVKLGRDGMFSDAPRMSADQVAQRVLIGEDLLNPAKGDKASDGKPKFPMPPESDLRGAWASYTGTAYASAPDTEAASYQAFRAFYAAETAAAGRYDGTFHKEVAERAAAAVTGGVVDVNDSTIVLPWGLPETYVRDQLRWGWERQAKAAGLGSVPFESISLQTIGDGVYAVTAGTGPVRGKDGQPMLLRVPRNSNDLIPQVPTGDQAAALMGGAQ